MDFSRESLGRNASAAAAAAPGYFTPKTDSAEASAPTSIPKEGAAPTSNPRENADGQKRIGKRREALNKAREAKKAVGAAVRKERPDSREDRSSQTRPTTGGPASAPTGVGDRAR
jgi:hypothetical protein